MNDNVSKPWAALWALVIGFFMILVDSTIVSVANPAILRDLHADITSVIWVTSGYLLGYAVPLLITGRLGDRFGPKRVYLVGLTVFTLASAWCGLSGSIAMLITARVVQGLGAAMMTPQTMAVITRIFPPDKRGAAMGLWGSVAGVATLVGPILGGVLVDNLGWQWIFFVNLPFGLLSFVLATRLVPNLPTHAHSFDWLGVALSAVGLFLVIFGLQEGETYDWGTIAGPVTVWGLIITGVLVLAGFVAWQYVNRREPLLPLSLYYQVARGMRPTESALMLAPMAITTLVMAPIVGRLTDRVNPKWVALAGFTLSAGSLVWLAVWMTPDAALWTLLVPAAFLGIGMSGVWSPLAATATRNLPVTKAGAGSGVYNMTRQVGAVLGSAAIAALINARLAAELPGLGGGLQEQAGTALPAAAQAGFTTAMSQSLLLPAAVIAVGVAIVACFAPPKVRTPWGEPADQREPVLVAD
jgi:multidrug resistance protein